MALPLAEKGQQHQFLAPEPSARYRFAQETFTGTRGSEREAPIPAGRTTLNELGFAPKAVGHKNLVLLIIDERSVPVPTWSLRSMRMV